MGVDVVEAYYAVARHMQEQADRKAEVADMLLKMANAMSEQRMSEQSKCPKCGMRAPGPGMPCGCCGLEGAT